MGPHAQRSLFWLSVMAVIFLHGCQSSVDYSDKVTFPGYGWSIGNPVSFTFPVTDTISGFSLFLDWEFSDDYPYQNIYYKTYTVFPSQDTVTDLVNMNLADKTGMWKGDCRGSLCTSEQLLIGDFQFLERAKEAEIDAICDGEEVHIMGIMEHIEPAGIHSGDSSAVLPPYSLSDEVIETMISYTRKLAYAINVKGLINIQFAISPSRDGEPEKVYVIEANPRASRTTPFIAKAYQIPYLNIATKVMIGANKLRDFDFIKKLEGYAIKVPVFSFNKFPNVDKRLGPEMKSTGEAIRFIRDLKDPFFRELDRDRTMYLYN